MTATAFIQGGARKPRHIICFASPHKWTSRTVLHDDNGRASITLEADDITTVRLDFAHVLENGETFASVIETASGCTASITYETPFVYLTLANPSGCEPMVLVEVLTSLMEQFTFRLYPKLPNRRLETPRVSSRAFDRGGIDDAVPLTPPTYTPPDDVSENVWEGVEW